ncbi:MAG: DNA polymerase III subunit epsilon [Nevskiales bacterium]
MRQIVLDTETTGLDPQQGHRIIEIGCVELVSRRQTGNNYQTYLNPEREIEAGAEAVHGISNAMLANKPRFAEITDELLRYLRGAELIIHNADFDVGFLNAELARVPRDSVLKVQDLCSVTDTLALARRLHPGQKNSLDALCKRYQVDNSRREYHGALLDAQLLAEVYLGMTGGQTSILLDPEQTASASARGNLQRLLAKSRPVVIHATDAESEAHQRRLQTIDKESKGTCLWPDES